MLDHGLDLEQLARDAIARGADCLGMAGGDGSQALVASIAVECGLPFVCVSAGTRNHFAQDLGLDRDDPRKSVYAFRGRDRTADRLRHGQRPVLRQQRVARRVRHDRAAGRLPRRQGRDDQGPAARAARATPTSRSISSSPSPTAPRSTARSSSRSRTTPMCSDPRSTPRSDAGSTPASSGIIALTGTTGQGRGGARRPRRHRSTHSAAATGTSSPPSASRSARVRARPLPASTAKPSIWRPRWCSGSTPAGSVSWCPARTSERRNDASLATSASTNCSMSHAGGPSGPVV